MKTLGCFTKFSFAAFGCGLFFTACGDDVTKVTNVTNENSGVEIAGSADDFDDCDSASIGKMMFASDENAVYICADSGWTPLSEKASDGKDRVSCTVETLKDSSGYKIVCGEDSVGVILNGKTGAKGAKGEDGENGTSCSVEMLADSTGYKIICGEDSVGVILNGKTGAKGAKGEDGENGTSCSVEMLADSTGYKVVCGEDSVGVILNGSDGNGCSLKDNGDGTLSQVCGETTVTLYKALCGGKAYDPAKTFCFEEKTYDYCVSASYDPTKQFCQDGNLYALCGGESYDVTEKFCHGDSLYVLCGGENYDVAEKFCQGDSLYALCNGEDYDVTSEFCQAGAIYALCDGESYDVTTASCEDGTVYEGKGRFTDDRDGKTYKTVKIGSQIWMAENLNYDYNQNTAKSYCYENSTDSCAKYGRLYTWAAAMDSAAVFSNDGQGCGYEKTCTTAKADTVRGVCPEGWHLPDSTEWKALETYVFENSSGGVGYALKSKSGWSDGGNGSDAFGFGALPAGYHDYFSEFDYSLTIGNFWSSSESDANNAYYRFLSSESEDLEPDRYFKNDARSVRCVKD